MFGARDQHLRSIRDALGVSISAREGEIRIQGDQAGVTKATSVLEQITSEVQRKGSVAPEESPTVAFCCRPPRARSSRPRPPGWKS